MAPSVLLMTWPTPELPWPACVSEPQLTVEPEPSVQTPGAAAVRYFVKFSVVPEPSALCTTVIAVDSSFARGFSALIAGSSQDLIWPWKILASVSAESRRPFTPLRLYDTVTGAATVGK